MTDITPDLNICLRAREAEPVLHKQYDTSQLDTFLQEAYTINARILELTRDLRSIRPNYLSTAAQSRRIQQHDKTRPLTDQDRDAFDASSKALLRRLHQATSTLKQGEQVGLETEERVALAKRARNGLGALGRWAAGGAVTAKSPEEEAEDAKRNTLAAFRKAVLLYLEERVGEASRTQAEMMEVRLGREIERSKSVLYKSRAGGHIPYAHDDSGSSMAKGFSSPSSPTSKNRMSSNLPQDSSTSQSNADTAALTAEQQQLFATENADLLKHYEDQMDQLKSAEKSILEISELHTQLHSNLEQQSEQIEQLVQDSYMTSENVGRGNKELKKASERRSTAQAVFWGTVGFCGFLVAWDFVF